MSAFGNLLRQARERSADPITGKKLARDSLAKLLGTELGITFTGTTIYNWETGKNRIAHDDWRVLLTLIQVLHTCNGLRTRAEANALLAAGNYRALDENEARRISPTWVDPPPTKTNPSPLRSVATATPLSTSSINSNFTPPRMTPAPLNHNIFGRALEMQKLFNLLRLDDSSARDVPPVALCGMAGVGKTTLAIALGRDAQVNHFFHDGVLWVSIGPKPTLRNLLDKWGDALGVNLVSARDEAMCQDRLRSVLFDRRALLIVDDVWDAQHAKTFHVGGPQCRIVFTTREPPIAYELATMPRTLNVNVLPPDASLEVLRSHAPLVVIEDEKRARELCERLGHLPLALDLAGRLLANEAPVPARLDQLIRELIEHGNARLDLAQAEARAGIEADQVSVRAILQLSVSRVSATDQERFAMLANFGGEPATFDLRAVTRVWDCAEEQAGATLTQLVQRGLVNHHNARYQMHVLVADYAEEMRRERGL